MSSKGSYLKLLPGRLTRTGFLLEHEVAESFRHAGWSVINNRFYVDDVDGRARELDLVIYKVNSSRDVEICTSLLVSCKKSEQDAFVFMSRKHSKIEPNIDLWPVHYLTVQEPLRTYLKNTNWKDDYVGKNKELRSELFEIKRLAFATQLVSRKTAAAHNDKVIFESIATLMKALDHEMEKLPSRIKKKRLYTFNLITVVDAPIVDAQCVGSKIEPLEVTDFKFLSRYIVRKRDIAARIHFVTKSQLESLVKQYSLLAEHDKKFFEAAVDLSYKSIENNDAVRQYFAKRLSLVLGWRINFSLQTGNFEQFKGDFGLDYDSESNALIIRLPVFEEKARQHLMQDNKLKMEVQSALQEIVRYRGKFRFEEELIPGGFKLLVQHPSILKGEVLHVKVSAVEFVGT